MILLPRDVEIKEILRLEYFGENGTGKAKIDRHYLVPMQHECVKLEWLLPSLDLRKIKDEHSVFM